MFNPRSSAELVGPQPMLVSGVVPPQRQDFAVLLAELHEVLHPVEVPLDDSMTVCCVSHVSQSCMSCLQLRVDFPHHPGHW